MMILFQNQGIYAYIHKCVYIYTPLQPDLQHEHMDEMFVNPGTWPDGDWERRPPM